MVALVGTLFLTVGFVRKPTVLFWFWQNLRFFLATVVVMSIRALIVHGHF